MFKCQKVFFLYLAYFLFYGIYMDVLSTLSVFFFFFFFLLFFFCFLVVVFLHMKSEKLTFGIDRFSKADMNISYNYSGV